MSAGRSPFHSHKELPSEHPQSAIRMKRQIVSRYLRSFTRMDLSGNRCVNRTYAHWRNANVGDTAQMLMAPMPRHPHHQAAAAYTNATAHPQRGHHRTTRCTSGSGQSLGSCRPHRRVRRPDTNDPGSRSRLPFLQWARHTSCRHSTPAGLH